jgi:hypothetical protein
LFFIGLAVLFAGAVYVRLRAVEPEVIAAKQQQSASTNGGAAVPSTSTAALSNEHRLQPTDTGTIVETTPDNPTGTKSASNAPSGMSTREQRYQELLRSAPAAPVQLPVPPTPAEEKPSFLKRVASAIGLGEAEKKPAGPAPRAPIPPRPTNQQQQSANDSKPQPDKTNEPKPVEERDPESDTRAPQLVGLEFNPRQVQDGETLTLAVTAQDDLSGIRTISGVIANPSGATVNGFAAQREGESNRYVARIVIPKDASEGNWHIKYLTLADNASNSVNLAYGQGLVPAIATFQVISSRSDSKGPELKALWIDKPAMSAGEKNTIFVQAEDDKAGVQLVSGVFVSPTKLARLGFGCRVGGTGAWECTLNVPECVDCGSWQLEQIQMQDKANNTTTVRIDNQMVQQVQVNISGDRCDGAAPVLTGLGLNPTVVSNAELSTIAVTATVQDDNCGGATLSGLVTGPSGQRLNILFDPSKDGQNFTGRIEVKPHTAKGTYVVAWIQALDKGQNLKAYSANDPVVGRVTFRIE